MDKDSVVHVIDDDKAVRDGIANLVEDMGLKVKTYASAEEFLVFHDCTGPDCLVLDIRMPGMSGMELLTKLSEADSLIPTVVVTGHGDVPMAVEAFKKGIIDFVQKPFREQALWEKIKKALEISADSREVRTERKKLTEKLSLLTDKEHEVLKFLLEGKNDKQIAVEMAVTRRAVAFHRTSVLEKLEITSIVELTKSISRLDISI